MPTTAHQPARPARWTSRLVLAVAVVGLLVVGVPTVGPAGWAAGCAEAAEGEVRVGIVVDVGTEPDAPGGPDVACVVVPAGATSAEVLRAWAEGRGRTLRYAPSGLLCGIGGYPASGCGEQTADGYRYWSYWEGTAAGWRYSSGNPHVLRATEGRVEGWRFQASAGTGVDDEPPRGPSSAVCPPAPATTVAPPPTVVASPSPTSVPPVASAPTVAVPGGPSSVAVSPSPAPTVAGGGPATTAPTAVGSAASGDPGAAGDGGVATPAADPGAPTPAPGDPDAAARASTGPDTGDGGVDVIDAAELAALDRGGEAGSSMPVGTVVAGALVLALGVGAGVRARRRTAR